MVETERAVFNIQINATKEAVWHELTKTDEPQDAMWHTILHSTGLQPGATYQMRTPSGSFVNVIGEILEYDPPHRLKQTVRFVRFDDPPATLTYEITNNPNGGVDLTLTIDDLAIGTSSGESWKGSGGGDWVCRTIKTIVESGKTPFSTRAMYKFFDIIDPLGNPKNTRVENWPMD